MAQETKDFEVISNSEMKNEEIESEDENESQCSNPPYSQDDRSFMFELYRENRQLLDTLKEKEKRITQLEVRNVYLVNSNMFWVCLYGISATISCLRIIY